MKEFEEIYEINKRLDRIFIEKYQVSEKNLFEKNCIEFLVELGEFVNETKCFKYWTNKKPNHKEVLEEYADCITMNLTFFNFLNLELKDFRQHHSSNDPLLVINYLYQQGSKLMERIDAELVKDIFINLLYLGELLNLEEKEIIKAIHQKLVKVEERLNSDY